MRLLKSALVVAALAMASPVWAHGGHGPKHHGHHGSSGHHDGWHGRHHGWHRDHHPSEWRHHGHRQHHHQRHWSGPRSIDERQLAQRNRIEQGVRSGELTRREARRLIAEQRSIREEERLFRADGVLSRGERQELQHDLNVASRHIYNEKHDAQTR